MKKYYYLFLLLLIIPVIAVYETLELFGAPEIDSPKNDAVTKTSKISTSGDAPEAYEVCFYVNGKVQGPMQWELVGWTGQITLEEGTNLVYAVGMSNMCKTIVSDKTKTMTLHYEP